MPPNNFQHNKHRIQFSPPRALLSEARSPVWERIASLGEHLFILDILLQCTVAWWATARHGGFISATGILWLLLFAHECVSVDEVQSLLGYISSYILNTEAVRDRPRYKLLSHDTAPEVDVFIPCCGEPVAVVMDTLLAVVKQDYPENRLHIFVLDDRYDHSLRVAVEEFSLVPLNENGPDVKYLSRVVTPGPQPFYKSGNLQFGLDRSSAEYFASLDADMIPDEDWLKRMLPHLLLDENLALACPPQRYYNVPDSDPFGQQIEFDLFLDSYEPFDDRLDPAMCTGSGFVARRRAVETMGGWPQVNTGEDFVGSALLSKAGWKVAFIREPLQVGLAPGSLRAHLKQRERWVDSGIIVHNKLGYYLPGSVKAQGLPPTVRVVGWLGILREYAPVVKLIGMVLLPPAMLMSSSAHLEQFLPRTMLSWIRITFVARLIAKRSNYYASAMDLGVQRMINLQANDVWSAPFTALRCVLSLLPSWSKHVTFISTASITSDANERSELDRKPFAKRLMNIHVLLPSLMACVFAGSLLLVIAGHGSSKPPFPGSVLKLADCAYKASIPLVYMIWPPTVPERDALMEIDRKGVRRPCKRAIESGRSQGTGWWGYAMCEICLVVWSVI